MLLVCIKIEPIAAINDLCLDPGLEALEAPDGPARSVIMGKRRTSKNIAWDRLGLVRLHIWVFFQPKTCQFDVLGRY